MSPYKFHDLLMYTYHPSPNLHIPHQDAIKWRIIKMVEDTIEATKEMFKVCTISVVSHNSSNYHHRQMSRENQYFS
jgi:hypothetical protein